MCELSCDADGVIEKQGHCDATATCVQEQIACARFACSSAGACRTVCTSSADCVAGNVCSADGTCVAPVAPAPADEGGCDCRLGVEGQSPAGRAPWAALVALGLVALQRVRRRRSDRGP